MQIHVVPVAWSTHRQQLQDIREAVFIEEQGVPREIEWDGQDEDAFHFLALNEAGQNIGCARMLPSGQIGRMAVIADYRHRGIGRRLLDVAVEEAKRRRLTKVSLHAQSQVVEFYRKSGFLPKGEEFMEAGIVHIAMDMELPIPFETAEQVAEPTIREHDTDAQPEKAQLKHFRGESECVAVIAECLIEPVRNVQIYSQNLDHALFDQLVVVTALSQFVRRGPPAQLQILIHSSQLIISRGHRLLELARRINSKISIRRVPDELATDLHTCLMWDARGYWLMPDFREYEGLANCHDPVQSARMSERFEYLWQKSHADSELRVLRL
ncbi:MAG: GNAT family N-acetyltransferase [Gammaproteobacteria bacterium]|nr:GNAT family N-acetyltransferase [Gammaproteobacteria bacterium]